MVPHSAKYWDFLSFPDFKARLRCSRLRRNRMMRGGRKCIVGQRWDYGVRREDQVEIQKMCWPQVVLLTCVCGRELCPLRHFSSARVQGSYFQWWCSFKAGKRKKNSEWDDISLKMYMCKMHGAGRPKGALCNNLFVIFPRLTPLLIQARGQVV